MLERVLNARMTFELTLWVATLAALVLLLLIVANLHLRLARLEHAPTARLLSPYAGFVGRHASEFLGSAETVPRVLLLLSAGCPACQRLLRELKQLTRPVSLALAWTRGSMSELAGLPEGVILLTDGAAVGSRVGVGITPFFLRFSSEGIVEEAGPVTSLVGLRNLEWTAETPRLAHTFAAR